jgi:hypothetical protein
LPVPLTDDRGTVMDLADAATSQVVEKLYYNSTGLCKAYDGSGNAKLRANTSYNRGRSQFVPFGYLGMYQDIFTNELNELKVCSTIFAP